MAQIQYNQGICCDLQSIVITIDSEFILRVSDSAGTTSGTAAIQQHVFLAAAAHYAQADFVRCLPGDLLKHWFHSHEYIKFDTLGSSYYKLHRVEFKS